MYLGGVPSHSNELKDLRETTGWYWLSFLKPQAVFNYKAFYLFWGGAALGECHPAHTLAEVLLRDALLPVPGPHLLCAIPGSRPRPLGAG